MDIYQLDWPPQSHDLNPIEHVWDMLGRLVRNPQSETIPDLRVALLEEWVNIPQRVIANFIQSLPCRMAAVIRARGYTILIFIFLFKLSVIFLIFAIVVNTFSEGNYIFIQGVQDKNEQHGDLGNGKSYRVS